jgi:hypothetical protein
MENSMSCGSAFETQVGMGATYVDGLFLDRRKHGGKKISAFYQGQNDVSVRFRPLLKTLESQLVGTHFSAAH